MVQESNTPQLEMMKSNRAWDKKKHEERKFINFTDQSHHLESLAPKCGVIKGDLYMGKYSPGRDKD